MHANNQQDNNPPIYRRNIKNSDTRKIAVIILKFKVWFYCKVLLL